MACCPHWPWESSSGPACREEVPYLLGSGSLREARPSRRAGWRGPRPAATWHVGFSVPVQAHGWFHSEVPRSARTPVCGGFCVRVGRARYYLHIVRAEGQLRGAAPALLSTCARLSVQKDDKDQAGGIAGPKGRDVTRVCVWGNRPGSIPASLSISEPQAPYLGCGVSIGGTSGNCLSTVLPRQDQQGRLP